jgi:hypothetical protein
MKSPVVSFAAFAALLVAGCGGGKKAADNSADQLEKAAGQSTPEAANVLDNEAQQIRAQNISDPNAAQGAMQAAGNAQTRQPAAGSGRPKAPPMAGAKPHRTGDPVPPPKLPAGQAMPGNSGANEPNGPR